MRHYFLMLIMLASCPFVSAKEYNKYDPQRMLVVSETATGKKYHIDLVYLDRMLDDLAAHAQNYPPRFDTSDEERRAIQDVKILSGMLDILINQPTPNPDLLIRAGLLNSIGYNLNLSGAAEKTVSIFQRLLAITPSSPHGNYLYGIFLAGAGKPKEALPYLETALSLGEPEATYAIGMTYLTLGNKDKALQKLQDYNRHKRSDPHVDHLIEAIRSGKIQVKKNQ